MYAVPYPQVPPTEDVAHVIQMVIDLLRKKPINLADFMHHAWCIQGYGQFLALGNGPHGPLIGSEPPSAEALVLADKLEAAFPKG